MTLKYESEILFDLMKRDGDDAPSDVLPYESELKEKYLKQVEGAYPKLQDYRSEWLNYNLNSQLPADFPMETISNVTEATVENVVPYAYKSAILKGQTLVNIKGEVSNDIASVNCKYDFLIPLVKKNTDYLIKYDITLSGGILAVGFLKDRTAWSNNLEKQPNIGLIRLNSGEYPNYFRIIAETGQTATINNLMIIEYQDGMENWDIPYFEGMTSVKMPVLTTTGKNLFNKKGLVLQNYTRVRGDNGEFVYSSAASGFVNYFDCQFLQGKTIKVSSIATSDGGGEIAFYTINKTYITGGKLGKSYLVPENAFYYRFSISVLNTSIDEANIQIEVNSVATLYEPFKSNILSTPEEVTLRGIGEAQDTLDCLTGEVVERVGEVVFDGSESWVSHGEKTNTKIYRLAYSKLAHVANRILCDKLPIAAQGDVEKIATGGDAGSSGHHVFYIALSKTKANTLSDFKSYLSENPLTVQYELATESVKTVDLSVIDQDGKTLNQIKPLEGTMHLSTSGENIRPLFSGEIPVEAITQNLASFIELEVEE